MSDKIKHILYSFIVLLIIQRLFHITDVISNPHSWRQFDTYFYAYDFYLNGINLFQPSVSWLGAYKTLILEFPIVSAIISLSFYLPGPELIYMRIISLVFFLASAFYLYKIVLYLYYERLALFTVMVYLMLPLGVYYSIALNIDFAVMYFALAMLFYYVKGFKENSFKHIIIGTCFAVTAYITKIPYAMIMYFPLVYIALKYSQRKFILKAIPVLVVPFIVFIFWQLYTIDVNAKAPDWTFIPGYFKFVNMSDWYFGEFSERYILSNWNEIFIRIFENVIMYLGIILFLAGVFIRSKKINKTFFNFYGFGLIIYLLIFFRLNLIHDYYQIPFLVLTAFYIGYGIDLFYEKISTKSKNAVLYTGIITLLISINGIWFTERWYYKPDNLRIHAAEIINNYTNPEDLIITSITDTDPRDPRILAASQRYGWSIRTNDINSTLIDSLKTYGATNLVIIKKDEEFIIIPNLQLTNKETLPDGGEILFYKLNE